MEATAAAESRVCIANTLATFSRKCSSSSARILAPCGKWDPAMVTDEQRAVEQTALGAERNQSRALDAATLAAAWTALGNVPDPEVPVVSIVELGIVRTLDIDGSTLLVTVTPTYSGCPATQVIEANIASAL